MHVVAWWHGLSAGVAGQVKEGGFLSGVALRHDGRMGGGCRILVVVFVVFVKSET